MEAFRNFASQLAQQVVDQLCGEFEREVVNLWNDVVMYRTELERVEQLLGSQLEREKKLHGVIENMLSSSGNTAEHIGLLAQQQPGSGDMKKWLDQFMSQHTEILHQTVAGVGQTNQVLSAHAASASQLKNESITAEHEFMRIANLLQQPLVSEKQAPHITPFVQAPRPAAPAHPSLMASSPSPGMHATPPRPLGRAPLSSPAVPVMRTAYTGSVGGPGTIHASMYR